MFLLVKQTRRVIPHRIQKLSRNWNHIRNHFMPICSKTWKCKYTAEIGRQRWFIARFDTVVDLVRKIWVCHGKKRPTRLLFSFRAIKRYKQNRILIGIFTTVNSLPIIFYLLHESVKIQHSLAVCNSVFRGCAGDFF